MGGGTRAGAEEDSSTTWLEDGPTSVCDFLKATGGREGGREGEREAKKDSWEVKGYFLPL